MNIAQAINASRNIGRIAYERYVELSHSDVGLFYPEWESLSEHAKQRWVSVAYAAVEAFAEESIKTTNEGGQQ